MIRAVAGVPCRAALMCAALVSCGDEPETARAVVRSGDSVVLEVDVAIASTAAERRAGLQGAAPLSPTEGLVLAFPVEGEVCLFNEGVGFAIDAVYAAASGAVTAVERNIAAGDPTARCHPQVETVLEVAGGVASEVAVGDTLEIR